jgi:hypothetical protein
MCRYERADAGCAGACLSCRPGQLLRSICRADGTCQCFVNDERYCDCAVDPALARSCAASCCWTFLANGLDASM